MQRKYILQGCLLMILSLFTLENKGQDTLRLNLSVAQDLFLSKNGQLLTSQYEISIAKAEVIQASLFNNPEIEILGNFYNPENKKVLDFSSPTGDYGFGIQQLLTLAGKRNKQINLAQTSRRMAEANYAELVRTLLFELRSDFYKVYYLQQSLKTYQSQIEALRKIDSSYAHLSKTGTVSLKDFTRIRALLYNLQSEKRELLQELNEKQTSLQILLQQPGRYIQPEVTKYVDRFSSAEYNVGALMDSAIAYRPELRWEQLQLQYNRQDLAYQQSLAVPDLTVGASYQRLGGHVPNGTYLNVGIAIPLFNKNQGYIKASKLKIEQSQTQLNQLQFTIGMEVQGAFSKWQIAESNLKEHDPAFYKQYEDLLKAVTENFQQNRISLIDFIDFYDSYRTGIIQYQQLTDEYIQSREQLNFLIGKFILQD